MTVDITCASDPSHLEPPTDGNADLIEQLKKRGVAACLVLDDSRPVESGFEAGWNEVKRAASFEDVLETAGAALNRLARRGDWLLWVDLAGAAAAVGHARGIPRLTRTSPPNRQTIRQETKRRTMTQEADYALLNISDPECLAHSIHRTTCFICALAEYYYRGPLP